MKLLRIICNFLMFVALCFAISCIQVGLFDITAAQSSDVQGIHIASVSDENVSYLDTYTFWGTDIGTNVHQDAKYRVRNWASWGWWKHATKGIDVAIDGIASVFKPIFVPVAQVNAVKEYYGVTINKFNSQILNFYKNDYEKANNALFELYVIYNDDNFGLDYGYGSAMTIVPEGETPISIADYEYTKELPDDNLVETDFAKWVRNNKELYNHNWKLTKYNCGSYDTYFTKFIMVDADGTRHIKAAVVALYYQQYVAIIIAFVFVRKYPINFVQGKYEGNDMTGKRRRRFFRRRGE